MARSGGFQNFEGDTWRATNPRAEKTWNLTVSLGLRPNGIGPRDHMPPVTIFFSKKKKVTSFFQRGKNNLTQFRSEIYMSTTIKGFSNGIYCVLWPRSLVASRGRCGINRAKETVIECGMGTAGKQMHPCRCGARARRLISLPPTELEQSFGPIAA